MHWENVPWQPPPYHIRLGEVQCVRTKGCVLIAKIPVFNIVL